MEINKKTEIGKKTTKSDSTALTDLFDALLLLKTTQEMEKFFKDLCTPQETKALSERWRVCQLLEQETLSYREIRALTKASLTTISRVARFLTTEPHQGYKIALKRIKKNDISTDGK